MTIASRASSSALPPWMWMSRSRQRLAQYIAAAAEKSDTSAIKSDTSSSDIHRFHTRDVYFNAARDVVAKAAPYPILPSLALPPGHAYSTFHPDGTPLLVYRDQNNNSEGGVQAYVNRCRHRGAPLLQPITKNEQQQCAGQRLKSPLLTCPYHAWTYDARNGQLVRIPGQEQAFRQLDTQPLSLQSLSCREQSGMIWVGGDGLVDANLWSVDDIHSELQPFLYYNWEQYQQEQQQSSQNNKETTTSQLQQPCFGFRQWDLQANWQLLVETGLESYHVKSLHQKTLHKVTHPTWAMVSEYFDQQRNFRMTVPLRNFDLDANNTNQKWTPEDTRKFLGETSTTHMIFPMTAISFFKRFCLVVTFEPIFHNRNKKSKRNNISMPDYYKDWKKTYQDKDTTTTPPLEKEVLEEEPVSTQTRVRAWGMAHRFYDPATEADGIQARERDFQAVLAAVQEDWDCAVQIQQGLNATHMNNNNNNASKDDEFVYGGYEHNNVRFLQNVGEIAEQLPS